MADPNFPLVQRFEPILFFHPEERFFPSDAKRYLEHCALWKAVRDRFDEKNSWGGKGQIKGAPFPRHPMIENGKIAAVEGEKGPGDTYLGEKQGVEFPFLGPKDQDQEERFLELTPGWEQPAADRGVTQTSENGHAALDLLEGRYRADPLEASRFWYHAEVFTTQRLQELTGHVTPRGLDLKPAFYALKNPMLICYYLFFPGHDEGLEGCENTLSGPTFGSFAGEWACVAVLLEREDPAKPYQATKIGLTSRNVGVIDFLDQEHRVGMSVFDFGSARVTKEGDHVRLFVARGTHSLYVEPGKHELDPFTKEDPSRGSCGAAEGLAENLMPNPPLAATDQRPETGVIIAKYVGGWVFGLPGALAGFLWAFAEIDPGAHPLPTAAEPPQAVPSVTQQDHAPEKGNLGIVVHPQNVVPPDVPQGSRKEPWPTTESTTIAGRTYSLLVNRLDPNTPTVWLPSVDGRPGYEGRWGPRVTTDPNNRRAGMRFPEFWEIFFTALAKNLSK